MHTGASHEKRYGVSLSVRVLCLEDCITMHFRLKELLEETRSHQALVRQRARVEGAARTG